MGTIVRLDAQKSVSAWIETISGRWTRGLDAVFDTGQALLDAKAALPHGEFEDMIQSRLPFGCASARKLMTIAAKPLLANRSIRHVLPAAWTVVYELCHLDDAELERWFVQGKIRPQLSAREVIEARRNRRHECGSRYASLPPPAPPQAPSELPQLWADKMIDTPSRRRRRSSARSRSRMLQPEGKGHEPSRRNYGTSRRDRRQDRCRAVPQ